ncbi:BCL2 associated agonist of cell death b [Carcharodon carcharias]|uniref:BCL2 associated agonist of cell death b n=1 Tax=Carcharodon carcharias TaxID=13397 RepID=UPI001B7E469D|nr:BCL2 associated agonist of cell death b [Carcharodon carcharias]
MATHFQISEFATFDENVRISVGERSEEGLDGGNADLHCGGARGRRVEAAETIVFHDGVPLARRVSLPEVELLEDTSTLRGRTRSEPPNFWLAVRYGRELRRMSDEFVSTFNQNKGLRISKSAGAIVTTFYRKVMCYLPGRGTTDTQPTADC